MNITSLSNESVKPCQIKSPLHSFWQYCPPCKIITNEKGLTIIFLGNIRYLLSVPR